MMTLRKSMGSFPAPTITADDIANACKEYYAGYKNGFRCGEIEVELGTPTHDNFQSPAPIPGLNVEAYHEAQRWGYEDGLNEQEPRTYECIIMHLDNEFAI